MRKRQKTTSNGQNLIRFKITASASVSTNMAKNKNKLQIGARNNKMHYFIKRNEQIWNQLIICVVNSG